MFEVVLYYDNLNQGKHYLEFFDQTASRVHFAPQVSSSFAFAVVISILFSFEKNPLFQITERSIDSMRAFDETADEKHPSSTIAWQRNSIQFISL